MSERGGAGPEKPADDSNAPADGRGDGGDGRGDAEDAGHNWLEWLVTSVGAVIVLGVAGILIAEILSGASDPPALVVSLGTPELRGEQMMVPVDVRNEGGRVAMDAVVEVCADPDDCAELLFAYVPHGSVRSGLVGFTSRPDGSFTYRVVSFRDP